MGSQTKNASEQNALAAPAKLALVSAAFPAIAMPDPTPKNINTNVKEAIEHKPSQGRHCRWLAPMRSGPNIRVYGGNW